VTAADELLAALRGEGPAPSWYMYEPLPGEGSPIIDRPRRGLGTIECERPWLVLRVRRAARKRGRA